MEWLSGSPISQPSLTFSGAGAAADITTTSSTPNTKAFLVVVQWIKEQY